MRCSFHHFETLASTNQYAKEHLELLSEGSMALITASQQTQGRGSHGKSWYSPCSDNFYGTFLFPFSKEVSQTHEALHLLLAVVLQFLESQELTVHVKWPNDILLGGAKLAGLLAEPFTHEGSSFLALGLGMNVNMSLEECKDISQAATSLAAFTKRMWDMESLRQELGERFAEQWSLWSSERHVEVLDILNQHLAFRGEFIPYHSRGVDSKICPQSILPDGRLRALLLGGEEILLDSGYLNF